MKPYPRILPEVILLFAIVSVFFAWLGCLALRNGHITMGSEVGPEFIATRCDNPKDFWIAVGSIFLFSALGWLATGLGVYRLIRYRNQPQSIKELEVETHGFGRD